MTTVFVSHSHQNDAFTRRLVDDLRAVGIQVWVDFDDILHGDFVSRINEALSHCEWVIPILTPESLNSKYVISEVNAALNLLMAGKLQGIIPVVAAPIENLTAPPLWNTLQRYDATRDYDGAMTSLLRALGTVAKKSDNPSPRIAHQVKKEKDEQPIDRDAETILAQEFHKAMLQLCDECYKAIRYRPTLVRREISERGGLAAAKWVINIPDQSSGITKLWEAHRLDLSVEALVLKPQFEPLFTREERTLARKTLQELGYSAPWDQGH